MKILIFLLLLIFVLSCSANFNINTAGVASGTEVQITYTGATTVALQTPYFENSTIQMQTGSSWGSFAKLNNGTFLTHAEIFSPTDLSWTAVPSAPTDNLWGVSLKKLNDGNIFQTSAFGYSIFDKNSETWSGTINLNENRWYAELHLLPNNKILIVGGSTAGNIKLKTTELYDVQNGTLSAGPNITNDGESIATVILDNGKVLVAGGRLLGLYKTTSEVYDYQTNTFTPTGDLNVARSWFNMIKLDTGKVLAFSGDADTTSGMTVQCELYDQSTGSWTLTGSLSNARNYGAYGKLRDGRVIFAGGYDQADYSTRLNSVEIYDPSSGQWSTSPAILNQARAEKPLLFELENGDVVIAGGSNNSGWIKSVEIGKKFTEVVTLSSSGGDGHYSYAIQSGPGKIVGDKFYVGVAGATQINVTDRSNGVGNFTITTSGP
jgi:hypothetical protein